MPKLECSGGPFQPRTTKLKLIKLKLKLKFGGRGIWGTGGIHRTSEIRGQGWGLYSYALYEWNLL
jgi:hypothetical protein